jgi:thiopurine S-methyltransferase
MADLLRPKGRLVGVFFYGAESDPPPFPLSPAEADATLGPWFRLVEDHAIPPADSLPRFAGTERWQVWRKK